MKTTGWKALLIGGLGIGFVLLMIAGVAGFFVYSFISDGVKEVLGGYTVTDGKVLYHTGLEGYGSRSSWEVSEADAASFEALGGAYAKDKNNAYLDGVIIPQSSGAGFKIIKKPYSSDQNHVFYGVEILSDAPQNFKIIAESENFAFSTDGKKVFQRSFDFFPDKVDAATFERIGSTLYFRDKTYVYSLEKVIDGADPQSFEAISGYDGVYARDKSGVFYNGVKVPECDAATHRIIDGSYHTDGKRMFVAAVKISDDAPNFKVLGSCYSKDSRFAYCGTAKISDDAANFTVFPTPGSGAYAKDSRNVFYRAVKVEKADAATFVGLNEHYGKDKKSVFFTVDQPGILSEADAATFELYQADGVDARDKNNNFNFGTLRGPRQ